MNLCPSEMCTGAEWECNSKRGEGRVCTDEGAMVAESYGYQRHIGTEWIKVRGRGRVKAGRS